MAVFWNAAQCILTDDVTASIVTVIMETVSKLNLLRYRHAGDKRERRYSWYSFLTSALDWDEWSAPRSSRTKPSWKRPLVPIG
jgi:hypothetical protein